MYYADGEQNRAGSAAASPRRSHPRHPPPPSAGRPCKASAVCKAWRRIITDHSFHGQYHALHPRAPVLGFLHRPRIDDELLPRFASTTSFRPAAADHRQHPLDCRHGRAVFYDYGSPFHGSNVVWDPATGELHKLPQEPGGVFLPRPTVICAAGRGCDHRGCSGGPYIVAFVGLEEHGLELDDDDEYETTDEDVDHDEDETTNEEVDEDDGEDKDGTFIDSYIYACFYSSDTGEFAGKVYIHLDQGRYDLDHDRPAALVGDSLYYLCWPGILQYRYGLLRRLGGFLGIRAAAGIREGDVLSMMELPRWEHLGIRKNANIVVMEAEGGGLGLACLCSKTGTMLYLLARETEGTVGDNAAAAAGRWVQRRVIDLKMLFSIGNNPQRQPCLSGIAQDANVIFVSTEAGVFSIDHGGSSLQARKVCEMDVVDDWMYPFVSFYTESLLLKLASSKLPGPGRNQ